MKFTYLLGAGASINAIPTVNGFKERLDFQSKVLNNLLQEVKDRINFTPIAYNSFLKYLEEIKMLSSIVPFYTSPDTLAKFYWLKNDLSSYSKIKNTLTIFFIIEQFLNYYSRTPYFDEASSLKEPKRTMVDPRYKNFIAGILNSPEKKWPENVLILNWNYDFQLQLTCNEISKGIVEFYPNPDKHGLNRTNILHLNGIAGVDGEENLIEFDLSDNNRLFIQVSEIIHKILMQKNKSSMKFAWEEEIRWDLVENHLNETEILVIIGYSFPTFNRKIDKEIFRRFNKKRLLQTIYFQNPKMKGDFLYDQFNLQRPHSKSNSSINIDGVITTEVINIDDGNRFHIPFEFE